MILLISTSTSLQLLVFACQHPQENLFLLGKDRRRVARKWGDVGPRASSTSLRVDGVPERRPPRDGFSRPNLNRWNLRRIWP